MRFLYFALLSLAAAPLAMGESVTDPSFESLATWAWGGANARYAYQSPVAGVPVKDFNSQATWRFSPGAGNGLAQAGSAFTLPTGVDVKTAAFLQGAGGSVAQSINFAAGYHTLTFLLGGRLPRLQVPTYGGNQTVEVKVGANVIGTFASTSSMPFTLQTANFYVATPGYYNLTFTGKASGDNTAFVDNVAVSLAPTPEPATLGLLASGLAGFFLLRRRRRE